MAQKTNKDEKDKGMDIDLDAFERQIDLEIDKLFVPSGVTPVEAVHLQETGGEKEEELQGSIEMKPLVLESSSTLPAKEPAPAPKEEAPSEIELTTEEIEFVFPVEPAATSPEPEARSEAARAEEPVKLELDEVSPKETIEIQAEYELTPPAATESPTLQLPDFEPPSTPVQAPEQTVQILEEAKSGEPASSRPAEPATGDELKRLIEALDVANLTLDWDFSVNNITLLESALVGLQPYSMKIHEASSLIKVIRAILQRLKRHPDSISPPLVDFLADALELLKSVMQSEAGAGPEYRERLKSLLDRLQSLKSLKAPTPVKEAQPDMEPATPQPASAELEEFVQTAPSIPMPEPSPTPVFSPLPAEKRDEITGTTLSEFCEWMVMYHQRMNEALQRLDEEAKRLHQLETTLAKKTALAPVTSRLTRVRSTLMEFITSFQQDNHEWANRVESLRQLDRSSGTDLLAASREQPVAPSLPDFPPQPAPPAEEMEEQAEPEAILTPEPAPQPAFTRTSERAVESWQETVCLFEIAGSGFALPASCVVKLEKIDGKKAKKLMERGYATLSDFKPLFRSVKTGVLGSFTDLPNKEIKAYRFLNLPQDIIQSAQGDSTGAPSSQPLMGTVILVSNKQHHAMIITDPTGAEIRTETVELRSEDEITLGTIRAGSITSAKVLNIDMLLKKLHGE
jgi:hypothetical protein